MTTEQIIQAEIAGEVARLAAYHANYCESCHKSPCQEKS